MWDFARWWYLYLTYINSRWDHFVRLEWGKASQYFIWAQFRESILPEGPAILQKNRWSSTPTYFSLKSTHEMPVTTYWNISSLSWIFAILIELLFFFHCIILFYIGCNTQVQKMQLDVDIEPTFKFSYMKCIGKQKDITMKQTDRQWRIRAHRASCTGGLKK